MPEFHTVVSSEPKPPNIFFGENQTENRGAKRWKEPCYYDNARKLVEAHLKGLELKENKKKTNRLREQKGGKH